MSEELVNIEINGIPLKGRKGAMVIEVADANSIGIPRFCYHKKLSIAASCRMCLVEVEKAPKPLPACATPVAEGMKIFTDSPRALAAQKATMEFLLINHPLDCPVCDQGGECELQDLSLGYGSDVSRYSEAKRVVREKNIGPLIATEMTRCIHCTRCVRFGEEIAGVRELGATGRGEFMEIGTWVEANLTHEMSGNVIDLCPVGALTAKPSRLSFRPWELTRHTGIAPHDGVGSNIEIHTRRGKVMRVVPRENEVLNELWISDRDRFSYAGIHSPDRLEQPMIRENGVWRTVDWEAALEYAVHGLRRVSAEERAGLASPSATLEELYLFQKFMRSTGTPHVDHRLRQSDFSGQHLAPALPWLGMTVEDLESVDAMLLVGCDVRREAPIIAHRLRKAVLKGGSVASIDFIDGRFHFPLIANIVTDPHGMLVALSGVAAAAAAASGVPVPDSLAGVLAGAKPDDAQRLVAERLAKGGSAALLLGAGAHMHPQAALLRALAAYIAQATGAQAGDLAQGGNAVGAWLAGMLPHRQAAGMTPGTVGAPAGELLAQPRRAYVLMGVEPEFDCDNPAQALAAMQAAETVVCLTPFVTETMRSYASVLLPIGTFAETSGTFVNVEGRWQSFAGAARAVGEARPAWKVLRVLGNLFDAPGFEYQSSEEVRDELKALIPADFAFGSFCDLERADAVGTIYRMPERASGLQRIGGVPMYAVDALVRRAAPLQATPEMGAMSVARIHPEQAEALGLADAPRVCVRQGSADAVLDLVPDEDVPMGCVWIPAGLAATAGLGAGFDAVELQRT